METETEEMELEMEETETDDVLRRKMVQLMADPRGCAKPRFFFSYFL